MKFFSGFSLHQEEKLLHSWYQDTPYTVVGFSYGAIRALRYVLEYEGRVDTLILLSPAFFQTRTEGFKRLQCRAFERDREGYLRTFYEHCFAPYPACEVMRDEACTQEQLCDLLHFVWSEATLCSVIERGIRIEVYIGLEDHIIDAEGARDFFIPYASVYTLRANHFLRGQND